MALRKAALLFAVVQALFLNQPVQAARDKQGCYDDYPMSCEEHKVPLEEIDFDLEEACYRIEKEVLLDEWVAYYKQSLHPDYLNGILAKDEFCPTMQAAYSHCTFCSGASYQIKCWRYTNYTSCGGKPTRQELLADNDEFPEIQSEEDIDRTCFQLRQLTNYSDEDRRYPRTKDLCRRVKSAKHLCPGECEGGCFDPETFQPSCEISQDDNNSTSREDWDDICDMLRKEAFGNLDNEGAFMASTRLDYFSSISINNPKCHKYRQAYSRCFWCKGQESLCFNDLRPPTCEATEITPSEFGYEKEDDAIQEGCYLLYEELQQHLPKLDDFYHVEKHTKSLFLMENTTKCNLAKQVYHRCLWCKENAKEELPCLTADPCLIKGVEIPPKATAEILKKFSDTKLEEDVRCDDIFQYSKDQFLGPYTPNNCYVALAATELCGDVLCPQIADALQRSTNYLGANTESEKKALIWASRTSAMLSFFGASYILYDVLTNPKSRATVYHQLLIGMAIFDIVTALAWAFATAPIDVSGPAAAHVHGAIGNDATCKAQGFFIQLGFTSVFYNVSLAIYYVLVIAHGWKEFQLHTIRVYMHLAPLVVGVGLAFAGLPVYHWIEYGCHIEPLAYDGENEGRLWTVLVFVVLPLGLSILAITGSMIVVYNSVRKRSAASRKWSFGIGQASKMEQAVFWQCLFYVFAFYITWPTMFAVYLASIDVGGPLALTITVAFVAPLQGFSNFLVYVRPQLKNRMAKRKAGGNMFSIFGRLSAWSKRRPIESLTANATTTESGNSGTEDEEFIGMDPSAALALRGSNRHLSLPAYSSHRRLGLENDSLPGQRSSSGNVKRNSAEKYGNQGPIPTHEDGTEATADAKKKAAAKRVSSLPAVRESFSAELVENQGPSRTAY